MITIRQEHPTGVRVRAVHESGIALFIHEVEVTQGESVEYLWVTECGELCEVDGDEALITTVRGQVPVRILQRFES